MVFALTPAAIGGGLIEANRLVWLIPPARRALEAAAHESGEVSFDQATWALLRLTAWALGVRGDLRGCKSHLGSGNVLMTPNDQYLSIVPSQAAAGHERVFLPLEEDGVSQRPPAAHTRRRW